MVEFDWIETNEALAAVCARARLKTAVALDTEFIRTRTFYPQLALIQLFDGERVALIDPLAISDFSPFVALLADSAVVKVLHACSEDLEIFHYIFQQMPTPLVDTQVMTHMLGFGASMGFAKLVQHFFQIELDKGASRTNWLKRPLSPEQLQYACNDVYYLLPAFEELQKALAPTPWLDWVLQEGERMNEKRTRDKDPELAYLDIGAAWQLNSLQLTVLKQLAKWRLLEAKRRDRALNFVLKEASLLQLAKALPRNMSQLLTILTPDEARYLGKKLLLLINQGRNQPPEMRVAPIVRACERPHYKQYYSAVFDVLTASLPPDFPQALVAGKKQVEQIIEWYFAPEAEKAHAELPELLLKWRKPFGEKVLEALALAEETLNATPNA